MTEGYTTTWITSKLAVGRAPMSYDDLADLKGQGIDAILNLCGEYCDLHDLEYDYGFEVYYLPIPDESAPDTQALERALAWLDEAIYLGKKVLVHCRFGVGRTGTVVTAYLLRKGLGLKSAAKLLKQTRANPSTYGQHKLLKKYGRREKPLTIRAPSLEDSHVVDLGRFFQAYEALAATIETDLKTQGESSSCGQDSTACCHNDMDLSLMEAIYLNFHMNRHLKGEQRLDAIRRASALSSPSGKPPVSSRYKDAHPKNSRDAEPSGGNTICPLSLEKKCLLYDYRPISCRLYGIGDHAIDQRSARQELNRLSNEVFFVYSGIFMQDPPLRFSLSDTVSGRFVQTYFYYLAGKTPQN